MRAAPSHHKTIASVKNGFCEGEHGSFAYGFGTCVICGVRKDYRTPRETKRSRESALFGIIVGLAGGDSPNLG